MKLFGNQTKPTHAFTGNWIFYWKKYEIFHLFLLFFLQSFFKKNWKFFRYFHKKLMKIENVNLIKWSSNFVKRWKVKQTMKKNPTKQDKLYQQQQQKIPFQSRNWFQVENNNNCLFKWILSLLILGRK